MSGKTKRWQVWAITSEGVVCYRMKAVRSVEEAADVLGDYRGIVMCDGYAVYDSDLDDDAVLALRAAEANHLLALYANLCADFAFT